MTGPKLPSQPALLQLLFGLYDFFAGLRRDIDELNARVTKLEERDGDGSGGKQE